MAAPAAAAAGAPTLWRGVQPSLLSARPAAVLSARPAAIARWAGNSRLRLHLRRARDHDSAASYVWAAAAHNATATAAAAAAAAGDAGIGRTAVAGTKKMRMGVRAMASPPKSDVPAFKGYPPMQSKPAWYWRLLACIPYLMPLCESWMYAETAYNLHCFLEQFEFWTYPFLNLLGELPSWFLLAYFFVAYLGIVRKNIWPHFFRFHVVTGMLLEILLQVVGTLNDWIPHGIYWGRIGAHFWLFVFFTYFLTTLESMRCAIVGMYADIPFVSDAAYMQIPYD